MQGVDLKESPTTSLLSVISRLALGALSRKTKCGGTRPVAFIGNDVSENFFSGRDPVGKPLQCDGVPYEVIGVAKAMGSVFGQSQDKFVMIPDLLLLQDIRLPHGTCPFRQSD